MAKDLNEQGGKAQLLGEKLVDTVEHAKIELVESVPFSAPIGHKKAHSPGQRRSCLPNRSKWCLKYALRV